MSRTIERNVVEMQFDNSNFEKNVQQSMSTIDKLKAALKFDKGDALKGISDAANNINLNGLTSTLENIENKFSTLGIVGMTTISRLTNEVISGVKRAANAVENAIVEGGKNRALNIERAKFQLKGLGIAWEDVSKAINYSVTDTAYSLDAAAQAAAQLATSGLDYKEVIFTHKTDNEELTKMSMALKGISGVAAQTGKDFSMVSGYFQDVATSGQLAGSTITYMEKVLGVPIQNDMAEGLKAIANGSYEATDAVRANAKKIVNANEVTADSIKDLAKKGLIDFDTFSTIMFNKYADHASAANNTYDGVVANIRSAFAKIGAEFYQPLIQNEGPLVKMLDKIRAKINGIKAEIIPIAQMVTEFLNEVFTEGEKVIDGIDLTGLFEKPKYVVEESIAVIKNLGPEILKVFKAIKETYRELFPKKSLDQFKESFSKVTEKLKNFKVSAKSLENIKTIFGGIFSAINIVIKAAKNLWKVLEPAREFASKIISKISGYILAISQALIDLNKNTTVFSDMSDAASRFKDVFGDIKWTIDFVVSTFKGEFAGCQTFVEKLGESIITVFTGALYTVVDFVSAVTGIDLSNLRDQIYLLWEDLTTFFHEFYDKIQENGGGIKGLAATIWEVIKELGRKFADWVKETTGVDLTKLVEKVRDCAARVKEQFANFLDGFKPLEKATDIINALTDAFLRLVDSIKQIGNSASIGLSKLIENPFLTLEAIAKQESIKKIASALKKLSDQGLASTITGITNPLNDLKNTLSAFQQELQAQKMASTATAIVAFSVAIGVLALAVSELSKVDNSKELLESILGVLVLAAGVFAMFVGVMYSASDKMDKSFKIFNRSLTSTRSSVKSSAAKIAAIAITFVAMAGAVKILASTVKELSEVDFGQNSEKLVDSLIVLIGSFVLLTLEFVALTQILKGLKISTKDILKVLLVSEIFKVLASSVKSMVDAVSGMQEMNHVNWKETLGSFLEVIGLMGGLIAAVTLIKVPNGTGFIKAAAALLIVTFAVSELVHAINKLNTMDPWDVLLSFGIVLLALETLMSNAFMLSGRSISIKTSVGLIALALSMAILCSQIKKLASMPIDEIAKGFVLLYGILGTFSVMAAAFKSQINGIVQAGVAMFAFAAALYVVASAIKKMSSIAIEDIALNLSILMIAMYSMVEMMKTIANNDYLTGALGMVALAGSLYIVANALKMLSGFPWKETSTNGLILLGVLAGLSLLASKMEGNIGGATTLLLLAAAILAVGVALKTIAEAKEWAFAAVGAIIVLVGILAVLALLCSKIAGPLLAGGAAIAGFMTLIAVGLAAVGGSLAIFGLALGSIAASVAAAAEGMALLGDVIIKLGVSFAMYSQPIKEFAVVMFKFAAISAAIGGGFTLLGAGAGIAAVGMAAMAVAGLALAGALVALEAALEMIIPLLGTEFKTGLENLAPTMEKAGGKITDYLAKGIIGGTPVAKKAAKQVADDTLGSFNSELGINSPSKEFMESGKFIDMGLADGITNNSSLVETASKFIGKTASESLSTELVKGTNDGSKKLTDAVKIFSDITEKGAVSAGNNVGVGFAKGLQGIAPKVKAYAANLAKSAMASMRSYLKIKSPSRVAMEIGEYTGEGFAIGMDKTEGMVDDSAQDLGKTAEKSLTTALSAAYDNLTSEVTDPTIKPVLDLSEIQNGASSIDSMLSRDYASNIAANYKSDRAYQAEQNAANNQLLSGLNGQLLSAIASNNMSDLPINVNIQLVGDAEGLFRTIVAENQRFTKMNGTSVLLQG